MLEILTEIKKFDSLYQNFYSWLAGQYDSTHGGFFYARSSRTSSEFQPDIESTAQAVNILLRSGLIQNMPENMRRQIIAFFQQRQQPETGFFYDPQNEMRHIDRMVGRAVMYSTHTLHVLGASPLYPIPGQKGTTSLPDYMKTPQAYLEWMNARDWNFSWMACDNIQTTAVYIQQLPQPDRQIYLDTAIQFLLDKQDPETGMWGEGRPYVKISGAFKLAHFYHEFNLPMPHPEKIYQSLLFALREDISEDMCWTRNPVDLLGTYKKQMNPFFTPDLKEIIKITYDNLQKYLKPDGGFSRHVEHSLATPNNVHLGKGLVEGDMNAGTQGLRIRSLMHQLAGIEEKPLEVAKEFYTMVKKVPVAQ